MSRLLLLLALAMSGSTAPRVGPESYGPVRVGMTVAQAGAALHVKLKLAQESDDPSSDCAYAYFPAGHDKGVSFMVGKSRIVRVDVVAPGTTTSRGIGVGSTIAALKAAYRPLEASRNRYSDEPEFEWRAPGGKTGLIFETENGRVVRYRNGRDPWLGYVEGCS